MGLLFASLPVVSRLFLGSWGFDGAFQVAALCLVLGTYLHIMGRKSAPTLQDAATLMDRASQLARRGQVDRGILLLTEAIRLNPRLWQAYQYRGELHLHPPERLKAALEDFHAAVRLAPEEPHLYFLRGHVYRLMGDEAAAQVEFKLAEDCQTGMCQDG